MDEGQVVEEVIKLREQMKHMETLINNLVSEIKSVFETKTDDLERRVAILEAKLEKNTGQIAWIAGGMSLVFAIVTLVVSKLI